MAVSKSIMASQPAAVQEIETTVPVDFINNPVVVVIPAYNEERFIGSVVLKVRKFPVDGHRGGRRLLGRYRRGGAGGGGDGHPPPDQPRQGPGAQQRLYRRA